MAEELSEKVLYGAEAAELHCERRQVKTKAGDVFQAEKIVTTIPWQSFGEISGPWFQSRAWSPP